MTRENILKTVDHTLLAQTATWEELKEICDDAIKYQTASVCIPASYEEQKIMLMGNGNLYSNRIPKWI